MQRPWVWAAGAAGLVGGAVLLAYALSVEDEPATADRTPQPDGPPDCDEVGPRGGRIAGIRYLERIRGNADPDAELPMVILFHSLGSKPEDFAGGLSGIGPARLILPEGVHGKEGGSRRWFREPIRKAVDEPEQLVADWLETSSAVRRFVDDVVRCRPTAGLPIVTGSSQGGEMAYLMGSRYPERFGGVVGVAGWAPEYFWTAAMPPTVGIHGTRDETVPYAWAEEYARTMQAAGADFEWHPYDVGHTVSSAMSRKWRESIGRMVAEQAGANA